MPKSICTNQGMYFKSICLCNDSRSIISLSTTPNNISFDKFTLGKKFNQLLGKKLGKWECNCRNDEFIYKFNENTSKNQVYNPYFKHAYENGDEMNLVKVTYLYILHVTILLYGIKAVII